MNPYRLPDGKPLQDPRTLVLGLFSPESVTGRKRCLGKIGKTSYLPTIIVPLPHFAELHLREVIGNFLNLCFLLSRISGAEDAGFSAPAFAPNILEDYVSRHRALLNSGGHIDRFGKLESSPRCRVS